jgi:hypothetical protein
VTKFSLLNSLKNISINFNGSNVLKTGDSSFKFFNQKSKNETSLDFSIKNSNNNLFNSTNSENLTSNSETNLNSIELNTSITINNNNNNNNNNSDSKDTNETINNNLKQINLASTTNSVYILEETFKLNKKNAFKQQNGMNRRENTNATDLNLPHVKQIESNIT